MDYLRGGPLLCCTSTRVPGYGFGLPWPSDSAVPLLILDDARLYKTLSRGKAIVVVMNAGTFAAGLNERMHAYNIAGAGVASFMDMGNGGLILGHKTRRLQVVQRYITSFQGYGMGRDTVFHVDTSDVWIAVDLRADSESAAAWSRSFGVSGFFGNPRLRDQLEPYIRQFGCRGVPLRISTRMSVSGRDGSTVDSIRADVTNIQRSVLIDSIFDARPRFRDIGAIHGHTLFNGGPPADSMNKAYTSAQPLPFRCGQKSN